MIVHVVPRGTIRRIMTSARKYREPGVQTIDTDTAERARVEIAATIPVFNVEAGRRELSGYYARARAGRQ